MKDYDTILSKAKETIQPVLLKMERMEEIYLKANEKNYTQERIEDIKDSLSAVRFKYFLSHSHLEELWTLSEKHRLSLPELIENSVNVHKWNDNDLLLGSMFLESFLFQTRAFIDFHMRSVCLILNQDPPVYMSLRKFEESIKKITNDKFKDRARRLKRIFENDVFGENKWGHVLRSIRDKIAHRGKLKPSLHGNETIASVLLDWPTIRKMTFERFAQDIQEGSFDMLRDTTPYLYELEWKTGPYNPNAWGN